MDRNALVCCFMIMIYSCNDDCVFMLNYNCTFSLCSDVDECANDTLHNCEQVCINRQGTFECDCNQGFELAENGRGCLG